MLHAVYSGVCVCVVVGVCVCVCVVVGVCVCVCSGVCVCVCVYSGVEFVGTSCLHESPHPDCVNYRLSFQTCIMYTGHDYALMYT